MGECHAIVAGIVSPQTFFTCFCRIHLPLPLPFMLIELWRVSN
jgi:hypothetical protein